MKKIEERSLRGLKVSLKIWRATKVKKKDCPICKKEIKMGDPCKVVIGRTKELTRYYHLRCYIQGLEEEVNTYKAIERIFDEEK